MRVILRCDDPAAVDHELFSHFVNVSMGAPGRCPECDAFGYIESADLVRCSQTQRCRGCGYGWSYQFDTDGALVEVVEVCGARRPPGTTSADRRTDVVDLTREAPGIAVVRR